MRRLIMVLILTMSMAGGAEAGAAFEVFLNNRPFEGAVSGPAADVLVEAEPYFQQAGGDFRYDAAAGTATLDGKPLAVQASGGRVFVRARDVIALVGGRYTANPELGTVDLYAFDPVETARKASRAMLAGRNIDTPEQLNELNQVVVPLLTRKLGMNLDVQFPLQLALVDRANMVRIAGTETTFFTSADRSTHTGQIVAAAVVLREGQRPVEAMANLAKGWGQVWAVAHGHFDSYDRSIGFALWVTTFVLTEFEQGGQAKAFVARHDEGQKAECQRLLNLQRDRGIEAVLQDVAGSGRR